MGLERVCLMILVIIGVTIISLSNASPISKNNRRGRINQMKLQHQQRKQQVDVPYQIHLAQGDHFGTSMMVSWMTNTTQTGVVYYGLSATQLINQVAPTEPVIQYNFTSAYVGDYTSPLIHHVNLTGLQYNTQYYYKCGSDQFGYSAVYSFTTPPAVSASAPYVFALIGDLGQTSNSEATIDHILQDPTISMTLLVGDLSYADSADPPKSFGPSTQTRWDSWGILVQGLTAYMPLMTCPGNHEIESGNAPATTVPFIAYQNRFRMPAASSGATNGNLYYSFEVASAHIIMLNSYMDYTKGSDQYNWLVNDLASIVRTRTPWVMVGLHAPWYNSNTAHHNEGEELGMKASMEELLYNAKVDLVFAGHVHAYERMYGIFNNQTTVGAPVHINIGDAGNREGGCPNWLDQPSWSAFRANEFGHGRLEIYNSTHAFWSWHTIDTPESVISDSVYLIKNSHLGISTHGVTAVSRTSF